MKRLLVLSATLALAVPAQALAWGATGHRMIGSLAAQALPAELPAFLRASQGAADAGELSRELDRSKGAGRAHDSDRDPGHFVDVDDAGLVLGGPALAALPATREEYDTALRAAGQDSWKGGYLPYSILGAWQQLVVDFTYWRILSAAEANPAWTEHRAFFTADLRRRENLLLSDYGLLSHYVGDGSQPMHVSVHYNGWGEYPNPAGYTTARIHGPFEGELVFRTVRPQAVAAAMTPLRLADSPVEQQIRDYLATTNREVTPLYQLEKAGGFAAGDPRGTAFATRRLAAGASELRDLVVEAWRASAERQVGYRPLVVSVPDVTQGRVDPYAALYGGD